MRATYNSGFVLVDTPEGNRYSFMADRANPAQSLRDMAEEHRQRAFNLLRRAVLMEQAADRLEG